MDNKYNPSHKLNNQPNILQNKLIILVLFNIIFDFEFPLTVLSLVSVSSTLQVEDTLSSM